MGIEGVTASLPHWPPGCVRNGPQPRLTGHADSALQLPQTGSLSVFKSRVLGSASAPSARSTPTRSPALATFLLFRPAWETALRGLDQRLDIWLPTEVSTARAAAMRRQMLQLNAKYQDVSYSLALAHPSAGGNRFAADMALRWKKRIAQEDAILNNLAR